MKPRTNYNVRAIDKARLDKWDRERTKEILFEVFDNILKKHKA